MKGLILIRLENRKINDKLFPVVLVPFGKYYRQIYTSVTTGRIQGEQLCHLELFELSEVTHCGGISPVK